jgi:hypothetical protein
MPTTKQTVKECFGCFNNCPIEIPDGLDENFEVMYWKIDCDSKYECYTHMSKLYQEGVILLGDGNAEKRISSNITTHTG